MSDEQLILIDRPAEHVARITLNRPEKRNAISTPLRGALVDTPWHAHDHDPEVQVTVVRGAGLCFSAGYDLSGGGNMMDDPPIYTAPWRRAVGPPGHRGVVLDLGPRQTRDRPDPRVACHGRRNRAGTSLRPRSTWPTTREGLAIPRGGAWRRQSPGLAVPHDVLLGMRRAMELMLTGDPITGVEAAAIGFANRAFPAADLEAERVTAIASPRSPGSPPAS